MDMEDMKTDDTEDRLARWERIGVRLFCFSILMITLAGILRDHLVSLGWWPF